MSDLKPPCTCPAGWPRGQQGEVAHHHHHECATQFAPNPALDVAKMEAASDRFIELGSELGLSRAEMASACIAIAANHLMATDTPEERAGMAMIAMYRWRRGHGVNPKLLVPDE